MPFQAHLGDPPRAAVGQGLAPPEARAPSRCQVRLAGAGGGSFFLARHFLGGFLQLRFHSHSNFHTLRLLPFPRPDGIAGLNLVSLGVSPCVTSGVQAWCARSVGLSLRPGPWLRASCSLPFSAAPSLLRLGKCGARYHHLSKCTLLPSPARRPPQRTWADGSEFCWLRRGPPQTPGPCTTTTSTWRRPRTSFRQPSKPSGKTPGKWHQS